jgi:hypothetical protein
MDIAALITSNAQAYTDLANKFSQAVSRFGNFDANAGPGLDIDAWLAALPAVDPQTVALPEIASPGTNASAPVVPGPSFVDFDPMQTFINDGYDSAYLEELEQKVRALTADVLAEVLPGGLADYYFRTSRAEKSRTVADKVTGVVAEHAKRGFPSMPMSAARGAAEVVEEWQRGEYAEQDKVAEARLDLARKIYFASIDRGVDIESLRSRVTTKFVNFYNDHNRVLVGYYRLLMDEKLAEAQLALENTKTALLQAERNVGLQRAENEAQIRNVMEVFQLAVKRLESGFTVDSEKIQRRAKALEKIAKTYAGWAVGVLGQSQSMGVSRHDVSS